MPELEQSIIVIPDPDLILNFSISPDELEELLVKTMQWKETHHNKRVSIKWHSCTTKALILQRNNVKDAAKAEKCNRFLDLIESYVDQGLIEYLKEHLCDLQAQPRNTHKYMICCMNAKRAATRNARVIFLSVTVANGSSDEAKFTNNEIELRLPKQLLQEFSET
uniref:TASOR PIN domain-containing protein n=1 Tax=Ditylenchus dipsaci TaxID=166011 RepID=A0A915DD25_9BILA